MVALLEFDRKRKSMSVLTNVEEAGSSGYNTRRKSRKAPGNALLVKGAAECVIDRCTQVKPSLFRSSSCCRHPALLDPQGIHPRRRRLLLPFASPHRACCAGVAGGWLGGQVGCRLPQSFVGERQQHGWPRAALPRHCTQGACPSSGHCARRTSSLLRPPMPSALTGSGPARTRCRQPSSATWHRTTEGAVTSGTSSCQTRHTTRRSSQT